jgi:hypothetical protein
MERRESKAAAIFAPLKTVAASNRVKTPTSLISETLFDTTSWNCTSERKGFQNQRPFDGADERLHSILLYAEKGKFLPAVK